MPESLLTKALAHLRANAVDGVFSATMASVAEAIGCVEQVASHILGYMRDHGNLEYVARGYYKRPVKLRIIDGVDTEWMARTIVWDDVMISQISTLWMQGLTASEIGVRLGITKNAVIGKARRLGLPARGSPIIRTLGEAVTTKPEHQTMTKSWHPAEWKTDEIMDFLRAFVVRGPDGKRPGNAEIRDAILGKFHVDLSINQIAGVVSKMEHPERHKRTVSVRRSTPAEPPIRPAITARHDQRHAFPVITARPTVRQPAIVRVRPSERSSTQIMSGKCQWPLWSDNARPSHKYCDKPAPLGESWCATHHRTCFTRGGASAEQQGVTQ